LLTGFDLGMQRITEHDFVSQVQGLEQLTGGRDLVALVLSDDPAQILPLTGAGVDHFYTPMAHLFAIHDHQGVLAWTGQVPLPVQQQPLQYFGVYLSQHPGKGSLFGTTIPAGVLVSPKTQGA
jgi:hypothetical protein